MELIYSSFFSPPLDLAQELKELIDMYVRFQKFKLGIDMIKEHNEAAKQDQTPGRQAAMTNVLDQADNRLKDVMRALDEFYAKWATEDPKRHELSNIQGVDKSVVQQPDSDTGLNKRLHHYVILRELMNHLAFSHKFMTELKVNKGDEEENQQKQRRQDPVEKAARHRREMVPTSVKVSGRRN